MIAVDEIYAKDQEVVIGGDDVDQFIDGLVGQNHLACPGRSLATNWLRRCLAVIAPRVVTG